jgi:hypothetical protein
MARMIKVVGVLAIAGLVLGYGLYGAKPKAPVKVRVSFEGAAGQKLLNDALGPYVGGDGITVQITSDLGDFVFEIPHHSTRGAFVIFPAAQSQLGESLPTPGVDVALDYVCVRTYNSFSTMKLNFLAMKPNDIAQVRLWVWVCTEALHSYRFIYGEDDPDHDAGIVEVSAYDAKGGDGIVDRWEIKPVTGTADMAYINRWDRKDGMHYFGSYPMPFKLIIERL